VSVLRGERVVLRAPVPEDRTAVEAVFADPVVAKWWATTPAEIEEKLRNDRKGVDVYLIDVDGEVAGIIQSHEEDDPDYRHAGIDISLTERFHGAGVAVDALRTLARHLFGERGHHRLVIDPAAHNARAIACYRKIGFQPVGVMRQYERGPDGTWHDGLLMDLLAGELH
jgi:aminoglycoside 6'-N-acetyltransferase